MTPEDRAARIRIPKTVKIRGWIDGKPVWLVCGIDDSMKVIPRKASKNEVRP